MIVSKLGQNDSAGQGIEPETSMSLTTLLQPVTNLNKNRTTVINSEECQIMNYLPL